jgi:subtilisin-like proprotein convertase family protein
VIVGDLTGPANYAISGNLDALALGTTSCNMGTQTLHWDALPAVTHPVIGGNLYRYSTVNGATRFEQIGQSWLKHAFQALAQSLCCSCSNPGTGSLLGVGCSDPYTATRNGTQSMLGPKYQVNAHTGAYSSTPPTPSGGNAGRIEFLISDVAVTAGGAGAPLRFFGESQYVTPDDAAAGNQNNNASYRELSTTANAGGGFDFAFVGSTVRATSAVRAWKAIDPSVTQTDVQVSGDGLYVVSSKATDLGGGMFHYEYNVYNMNGDRDGGSFSVPIDDAVAATNIGFSCPVYRYGDGDGGVSFSSAPWTTTKSGGMLTWTPGCSNNAIRWGTSYNFRFDAAVAPAAGGNVAVGLWKPGTSTGFVAAAQSPGTGATVPAPQLSSYASAAPDPVAILSSTLLKVTVFPSVSPPSTGIAVTADLSAIQGSSNQAFYDDGTHGDAVAGDGTYSFLATLAQPMSPGAVSIPYTVTDQQSRSSSCAISLTATSAPIGRCCGANGVCSIQTAYACNAIAGIYLGDGTNCNGTVYSTASFPVAIPDNLTTGVSVSLVFPPGSGTISGNANVTVGLTHTYVGDLIATLTHGSTTVTLFSRVNGGNNSRDLSGVYGFSDSASATFASAAIASDPILSGTYRPSQALSAFNGQLFDGTWTFNISDRAAQDTGTVNSMSMSSPVAISCPRHCGTADFNCDGNLGTDADIEAFFDCLSGTCPPAPCTNSADFDGNGDVGTDSDIAAFFTVLAGGTC